MKHNKTTPVLFRRSQRDECSPCLVSRCPAKLDQRSSGVKNLDLRCPKISSRTISWNLWIMVFTNVIIIYTTTTEASNKIPGGLVIAHLRDRRRFKLWPMEATMTIWLKNWVPMHPVNWFYARAGLPWPHSSICKARGWRGWTTKDLPWSKWCLELILNVTVTWGSWITRPNLMENKPSWNLQSRHKWAHGCVVNF